MDPDVFVVKTGIANTASVLAGLSRAGANPLMTDDPKIISRAARIVLPGVGAFGAGMTMLREAALERVLKERVLAGKPTLAVCVGLQLLFEQSEESPGVSGIGAISAKITRFPDSVCVPQLGWNKVEPEKNCQLLEPGYAYFANSFKADVIPEGWRGAYADHGGQFVAALERGSVLCCQFHPELSGAWGISLLRRWLEHTGQGVNPSDAPEK